MIYPGYIKLRDWAASLQIDFPTANVPILYKEEEWKKWARSIADLEFFKSIAVPPPSGNQEWNNWAKEFYRIVMDSRTINNQIW